MRLKEFRDIKNSISALRMHDIDISNWDPIFVYLWSTKLPVLTSSLWEQTIRDKIQIPKLKDLDDFLTSRFQSLETIYGLWNFESVDNCNSRSAPQGPPSSRIGIRSFPTFYLFKTFNYAFVNWKQSKNTYVFSFNYFPHHLMANCSNLIIKQFLCSLYFFIFLFS